MFGPTLSTAQDELVICAGDPLQPPLTLLNEVDALFAVARRLCVDFTSVFR